MNTNNVVVLIGRMVADPVLRYLPSGKPVAEFSLAINRSIRKDDGSFEDKLDGFFDCELYDGIAVAAAEFKKGTEVYLLGSLIQNRFETKSGQKASKLLVRGHKIGPALRPAKDDSSAQTEKVATPA